jgi:hypothetical protein
MPPVVPGEEALARPGDGIAAHPGNALAAAVLHFHHVRNGMLAPAIAGLEFHALPARGFGARIVARLLEAERAHSEHRVIAGNTLTPRRQCACDAVAQHARVPGEEVNLVAALQRERIARILHAQILERPAGRPPAPLCQKLDRVQVAALAVVGGKRLCRLMRRARHGQRRGFRPHQVQICLEDVPHYELRARCKRALHRGNRVAI